MPLLVAIATYNEIENLPPLVAAVHAVIPHADVLVVDDNSPDGTGSWCDAFAAENPWLRVIHRPGKLGLGSATWLAMQEAIEQGYDRLATMDADWSHPPAALPALVDATEKVDVVIGSRYCPGGRIEGWPLSRKAISRVMNIATKVVLGMPASDASTAFRVYRIDVLRKVDFSQLTSTGYAYLEELLFQLNQAGARIGEVPVTFTDRREGESKVNWGEARGKLAVLWRLGWKRLSNRRNRQQTPEGV